MIIREESHDALKIHVLTGVAEMSRSRLVKLGRIVADSELRWALKRFGVAGGVEHRAVLAELVGCTAVVDVGANKGQFALVARQSFPDVGILSFEPLASPATVFEKVFSRSPNVRLYRSAIGPVSRRAAMHLSARDDSSSLLPITKAQSELFAGTQEIGTEEINVGPLDAFVEASELGRRALLKIDVQGFELQALKGCASYMDRFEWAYVESSFVELYEGQAFADEVIAWLRERGLKLRGIYNMSYSPRGVAVQADFLFGRQ